MGDRLFKKSLRPWFKWGFGKIGQSADPASQETCLAPSSCSLPGMAGCSGVNRDGDEVGIVSRGSNPFFNSA